MYGMKRVTRGTSSHYFVNSCSLTAWVVSLICPVFASDTAAPFPINCIGHERRSGRRSRRIGSKGAYMLRSAFSLADLLVRTLVSLGLVAGLLGLDLPGPIALAQADPLALQPATETPTPDATASATALPAQTETETPTATSTTLAKATVTPTNADPLPRETSTATAEAAKPTVTVAPSTTATPSPSSTQTASPTASETPTETPTATAAVSATETPTPEVKVTATQAPSEDRGVIDVSKGGRSSVPAWASPSPCLAEQRPMRLR